MDKESKWTPSTDIRMGQRGAQENSKDENGCWAKCQNRENLSIDDYEKATQFWLFSCKRPHMRGFQASWFGTFIAFFGWFCVQSLVPDIQEDLNLTDEEVANSGITAVASVIGVRLATGPLTDRFGPKRIMAILLMAGGISLGITGLTSTATGLMIARFFIGILGATIVPCHSWAVSLFSSNIVGSANSLAAGWGNVGGGVAFLVMPLLLRLVLLIGVRKSNAWKITLIIPAIICLISAVLLWLFTDDCPQGRWRSRKTIGETDRLETANGTVNPAYNSKSWFCVQSLVPDIQEDLNLTDEDVVNSGIAAVASVIGVRLAAGPLTDRFGPRRIMAILLMAGGISLGITGLISTANGLIITRFFIGILDDCPQGRWSSRKTIEETLGETDRLETVNGTINAAYNSTSDDSIVPVQLRENNTSKKFTKHNNQGFRGHVGFRIFAIAVLFIQFSGIGISICSTMNLYLLRKSKTKTVN
ncbi:unnamed protein product [Owenia fusiformis]|uniref:Major facilitator superfamily (MFS) profile domain-containing protein n=1 Tax=Owenia fusiformis TaxID=6347 RepID=A0A8S4PC99_OWEFU|nr:unnamed protein product [Owenia fusiformis]